MPNIPLVPESPRSRSASPTRTLLTIQPNQYGAMRDWESFSHSYAMNEMEARSPPQRQPPYSPVTVKREGSPTVAVLREATERANQQYQNLVKSPNPNNAWTRSLPGANQGTTGDSSQVLLDHQGILAWRREEWRRRQEAEERGEIYEPRSPYPGGEYLTREAMAEAAANRSGALNVSGAMNIDFRGRARNLPVQVLATPDEIAWLQAPPIPDPIGWNGYWDLCAGHEAILQIMAVSGANPQNSPSLTEHFMYPELLSCIQRLQAGTYMIRYHNAGEPPHERYFYLKSLPLANRAQYAPFLCWSVHKNSHNAQDCIPLPNIMWVTQGIHSPTMRKYYLGGNAIQGPFVGKKKVECLAYGCMSIWYYDGANTRNLDVLATDPLAFTMWMKLLEDVAHLNAALDTSGKVRRMQKYIENRRMDGSLAAEGLDGDKKKKTLMQRFNLE